MTSGGRRAETYRPWPPGTRPPTARIHWLFWKPACRTCGLRFIQWP